MQRFAARYVAFFRPPDVARLFAMAFVARMPIGMLSLALLMHLRALTGSFALAGATVGGYLVAMALTAPALGRAIDRQGPRAVLVVAGIVQPLALAALLLATPLRLSQPAIVAMALLAGMSTPPISVLTRTLWRHRFHREEDRQTAFAVDSVLVELNFTLGPALIALLLTIGTPALALAGASFFAAIAAPLFLRSPATRHWKLTAGEHRHLLGPLTEPRLLLVFATTMALTFAFGLLEVGYPGFAVLLGFPALGGVLIAINSMGSALGGTAYGGLHIALPVSRQLPVLLLTMALPVAAHAFVTSPWLLAPLALLAGLLIAPSITALIMLVTHNAPMRYATEAFTWSTTCIVSGVGAGTAVGGQLIEHAGPRAAFALAAASTVVAALLALPLARAATPITSGDS